MPILQAAVHSFATDQHPWCGLLFSAGNVNLSGDLQIYLAGDNGDEHYDDADTQGSNCNLEVFPHDKIAPYSGR